MAMVITQVEMMKYAGMRQAVFPAGAIVTPAARDWAGEQKIEIVVGESSREVIQSNRQTSEVEPGKELLHRTVKAILNNMDKAGGLLKKEELVEAVAACLCKMGCTVRNE